MFYSIYRASQVPVSWTCQCIRCPPTTRHERSPNWTRCTDRSQNIIKFVVSHDFLRLECNRRKFLLPFSGTLNLLVGSAARLAGGKGATGWLHLEERGAPALPKESDLANPNCSRPILLNRQIGKREHYAQRRKQAVRSLL
jgi:hypothetical protein